MTVQLEPVILEDEIEQPAWQRALHEARAACNRELAALHAIAYPNQTQRLFALRLRARCALDSATKCFERQYEIYDATRVQKGRLRIFQVAAIVVLVMLLGVEYLVSFNLSSDQILGVLVILSVGLLVTEITISRHESAYEANEASLAQARAALLSLNISEAFMAQYVRVQADPKKLPHMDLEVWGKDSTIRSGYFCWGAIDEVNLIRSIQRFMLDLRLVRFLNPGKDIPIPYELQKITVNL